MASRREASGNAANDLASGAAEAAGGADAAVGVNPLFGVGGGAAEVMAGFREIGLEAMTHPWLGVEPSTQFVEQVGRAWLGRSDIEPKRGDKRFADCGHGSSGPRLAEPSVRLMQPLETMPPSTRDISTTLTDLKRLGYEQPAHPIKWQQPRLS